MAITWTPTTTPLNVATYEAEISVTRLDDVTGDTKTFVVPKAPIETNSQKLDVANEVWEAYQNILLKDEAVSTFVDTFNTQLKDNLEARE